MKIKSDRIAELEKFGWKGNNFEEADMVEVEDEK